MIPCVTSLRDVRLLQEPTAIIRGGTAALICARDMQGSSLYAVQWYRGNHEFYRYTPGEEPPTRRFPIPGINVDLSRSNGSQVMLRKLDLNMAGNYSCEVTADAPHFSTMVAATYVDVIALPTQDPTLSSDKDRYQPGELLRANCTSSPSKPATNLTIYINEEPLRSSETSLHPHDSGLQWTSVNAELKVTSDLFPGGRLRVACVASIYEVYRRSAILDFFTPETDPRPERITLNNSSSRRFQSWILLFLLLLLPMVVIGEDYGLFNDETVYQGDTFSDYYDDHREHTYRSLVGG
ncbi:hypothetical protein O0L34_g17432 [Tuta absoluta]|nr:hypothetical protein O0L34_g17432 [Tuta absoluta]